MTEKVFSKSGNILCKKIQKTKSNTEKNNTNKSFGEMSSTSVPGGNQVDGLPPASSVDWCSLPGHFD